MYCPSANFSPFHYRVSQDSRKKYKNENETKFIQNCYFFIVQRVEFLRYHNEIHIKYKNIYC